MTERIEPAPVKRREATHRVTWANGQPTFHCDGDRSSACHWYPDCEHEYWPCEHAYVEHDECWQLPWLEASPVDAYCSDAANDGPPPEVDGVIDTEWEGECLLWGYVEAVSRG